MTDDKRIARALKALVGVSLGQPEVQPVINAKATRNGVTAAPLDPAAFFKPFPPEFTKQDIRMALQAQGRAYNDAAFYDLIKLATKAKVIKRVMLGRYKKL